MMAPRNLLLPLLLGAACGHPRVEPHSMSAREHEAASHAHAIEGEAHAQQATADCRPADWVCWTSPATGPHAREAAAHREAGEEHAVAAVELTDQTRSACANVAPADRENGAFSHRGDLASVTPVADNQALRGARIAFQRVPGLTAERLQAIVTCERAELAEQGHPATSASPLAPAAVAVSVSESDAGLVVTIVSADPQLAHDIFERASRLMP